MGAHRIWNCTRAVAVAAVLLTAACSDDDDGGDDAGAADGDTPTTTDAPEPTGPAATVDGPVEGGNGVFIAEPALLTGDAVDLDELGFVEEELVVSGTASSFEPADGELPADGTYDLIEADSADYRTRVLVRRPAEADDFNGTVVVEWLNVSGGVDANPVWVYNQEELLRGGYAWVGVSAQLIGVEGGPVIVPVAAGAGLAGEGLKAIDPERYGDLTHPGDSFSYDIFTQVGRTVRSGGVLGDLEPELVLGVGESQSAFTMTTYLNGVQPLAGAFDGFMVHSRGGAPAPLTTETGYIDLPGSLGGTPTTIRTDLDVPVMVVQTETDVVSFLASRNARQPDTDLLRTWEVAGSAHVDAHMLGPVGDTLGCPVPVNDGPQHVVLKAALRALAGWAGGGDAPPTAEPVEVDEAGAAVRDELGIIVGGLRTPLVDVPTSALSGEAPEGAPIVCILAGTTAPIDPAVLAERYDSLDAYLEEFEAAADAAIAAGFVLAEDREALLDMADPSTLGG